MPSDLGLHCLSRPFWQASVRNFRTFTVLAGYLTLLFAFEKGGLYWIWVVCHSVCPSVISSFFQS